MADYSNYEVIKTEKIVTDSKDLSRNETFEAQRDKVNDFIKRLQLCDYEVIEITHNDIASETRNQYLLYTITNITYGKPKTPKK